MAQWTVSVRSKETAVLNEDINFILQPIVNDTGTLQEQRDFVFSACKREPRNVATDHVFRPNMHIHVAHQLGAAREQGCAQTRVEPDADTRRLALGVSLK